MNYKKFTIYELVLMGIAFEDDKKAISFIKKLNDELKTNIEKEIEELIRIKGFIEYNREMTEKERQKWLDSHKEEIEWWKKYERFKLKCQTWGKRASIEGAIHNEMLNSFAEDLYEVAPLNIGQQRKLCIVTLGDLVAADLSQLEELSAYDIGGVHENILNRHERRFKTMFSEYIVEQEKREKEWRLAKEKEEAAKAERIAGLPLSDEILRWTLEEMDLSARTYRYLKRAGKNTLADLAIMTLKDLLMVRNMGRKSVEEIRKKLEEFGVVLEKGDRQE